MCYFIATFLPLFCFFFSLLFLLDFFALFFLILWILFSKCPIDADPIQVLDLDGSLVSYILLTSVFAFLVLFVGLFFVLLLWDILYICEIGNCEKRLKIMERRPFVSNRYGCVFHMYVPKPYVVSSKPSIYKWKLESVFTADLLNASNLWFSLIHLSIPSLNLWALLVHPPSIWYGLLFLFQPWLACCFDFLCYHLSGILGRGGISLSSRPTIFYQNVSFILQAF